MSMEKRSNKRGNEGMEDGLELIDMKKIGKKRKHKRKKNAFDYIRYSVMVIAAVVFVVAGYNLYSIYSEYAKGEQTYEDVTDTYTKDSGDTVVEATGDVVAADGFRKVNVDFQSLQKKNPDVKAWIQFEAMEISYPVLQHPSDNNYYLKKMWDRQDNTAGSIFIDVTNNSDFQDANTFVYGHNMKNLSMFGSLKKYKEKDFYKGKEYFWIYTPEVNYRYVIFSIHEAKVDGGMFRTFEQQSDEYLQYLADAKKTSRYDTGIEVGAGDKIVTLSTCTAAGDNWRLLLHGKLIGVEKKASGQK